MGFCCQYFQSFIVVSILLALHSHVASCKAVSLQWKRTAKSNSKTHPSVDVWQLDALSMLQTKASVHLRNSCDSCDDSGDDGSDLNWSNVDVTSVMTLCADRILDAVNGQAFMSMATNAFTLVYQRLPKVQKHVIFYCKAVEQHVKTAFQDLSKFPGLHLKPMGGTFWNPQGWAGYQKWMVSSNFWNEIEGDKVLVYQPDVHICNSAHEQLQKFFKYDYVGAPWPDDLAPVGDPRRCSSRIGNGGLSLRDVENSKSILSTEPRAQEETGLPDSHNPFALPEDTWWCQKFASYEIPTVNVAAGFAVQGNGPVGPTADVVGVHDVFNMTVANLLEPSCNGIVAHMESVKLRKMSQAP